MDEHTILTSTFRRNLVNSNLVKLLVNVERNSPKILQYKNSVIIANHDS